MTGDNINLKTAYRSEHLNKLYSEIKDLRNQTAGVQILLGELAQRMKQPRAQMFANEGIGRRLPLVARCVQNIFQLYPPDTEMLLTREVCDDIAIHLHAFAINVYAIFDNIAWACMLEAGGSLPPLKVSPFKQECARFLPSDLKNYIARISLRNGSMSTEKSTETPRHIASRLICLLAHTRLRRVGNSASCMSARTRRYSMQQK